MPRSARRTHTAAANVILLGIDFSWAALEEREGLSYDGAAARRLLIQASALPGFEEGAVLSTCNRTEFYLVGAPELAAAFLALIHDDRPATRPHSSGCRLRQVTDDDAVRHLFAVASGAASLILGDSFIVGQLKAALRIASDAGTLGPVLNQLFRQAFALGARARRTTDIGRGESGLGAIVASIVAQHERPRRRALLIGAGMTARDIARQITKRDAAALTIANRTDAHAEALARSCGAASLPWSQRAAGIESADVVICAIAAAMPIITEGDLGDRLPLLIDVGVPRNIAPPAGATCLTIDDLTGRQEEARLRRERARPQVEALIGGELREWQEWRSRQPVEGMLKRLFQLEAEARQRAACLVVASGWPGSVDDAAQALARLNTPWLKRHAAELRHWAQARSRERGSRQA